MSHKLHVALESPTDSIGKGSMCSNLSGREKTRGEKASELTCSSSEVLQYRGSGAAPGFGVWVFKISKANFFCQPKYTIIVELFIT